MTESTLITKHSAPAPAGVAGNTQNPFPLHPPFSLIKRNYVPYNISTEPNW